MTEPTYEYRGMIAAYWDLLRGDTSGWSSRPYFLRIIQESGQPALDVACGTGRLLLDYAQEGVDIDGVDVSPDMVALAREKAEASGLDVATYVQPMQDLDLPRRYRTIIVPSSSFLHLTSIEDARRALARFFDHLLPGGRLAMSMRVMDPNPVEVDWEIDSEAIRPADGALVRRWFRCRYDVEKRLQHTEDRYEIIQDGLVVHSENYVASPTLTWYPVSEALDLLREAGLVDVEAHADFEFVPAADDETSYIVLGRRPSGG